MYIVKKKKKMYGCHYSCESVCLTTFQDDPFVLWLQTIFITANFLFWSKWTVIVTFIWKFA